MERIRKMVEGQYKTKVPTFGPGDQVRVWYRIHEQGRVRQAPFEGIVIRRRGAGLSATFTVRRVTHGEGVERVFPVHAPVLERIEVLRHGKVRRAKLYYLRTQIGKMRITSTEVENKTEGIQAASEQTPASEPASEPSTDVPVRDAEASSKS